MKEQDDKSEEEEVKPFHFFALPKEIQFASLHFLSALDIISIGSVCKELHDMCKEESIWKNLSLRMFGDLENHPNNWRSYFYERVTFLTKYTMEWKQKDIAVNSCPSPRQSLTGNYVKGKVVYIGGQTSITVRFDEIYYFDPDKKTFYKPKINGCGPPKFARHASVEIGNKVYVFGGFDGFGSFFGLGVFDADNCTWTYPNVRGTIPIPRTNHAITAIGTKIFLFGGNDTTKNNIISLAPLKFGTYGDFHMFDTETLIWSEPQTKGIKPCARSGHHMLSVGKKLYLFGGGLWNDKTKQWIEKYNDMHTFDIETMKWMEVRQVLPNVQAFISLPHWKVGNFIFVYHDPLWCFDTITNTWHIIHTKGIKPQKRFLGPATAIPQKHSTYLFGGVYTSVMNNFDQLIWPSKISLSFNTNTLQDIEDKQLMEQPVSSN